MNRRGFIVGIGVGFGGVIIGAAGWVFAFSYKERAASWVSSVVNRHLASGGVVGSGVDEFSYDYVRGLTRKKSLIVALKSSPELGGLIELSERVRRYVYVVEREVITEYLLNSDMFGAGADSKKVVRYHGQMPVICLRANPFARFL